MYIIPPPVEPMLSKASASMPQGEDWSYEPKWDGFRAIVFRDGAKIHISSRNARPLERYFPELLPTLADALPKTCVIDGEVVVFANGVLDFDALQMRIHPAASRVKMLSEQIPASFIAFDALANAKDLREKPLALRRAALAQLFSPSAKAHLTPTTQNHDEADRWFKQFEGAGCDGIIAKRNDEKYRPGERAWVKVKHMRTADCVVGGYRVLKGGGAVGSLLLALYGDDGSLVFVGHTSSFSAGDRKKMLPEMRKLAGDSAFGELRSPGAPSRWSGKEEKDWFPIKPVLVCEVAYDHMQGQRFRHATTFKRWRTDKDPKDCTYDQLIPPDPINIDEVLRL